VFLLDVLLCLNIVPVHIVVKLVLRIVFNEGTRWVIQDTSGLRCPGRDTPTGVRRALIATHCGDDELGDLVERLLVRCEEEETRLLSGRAMIGAIGSSLERELEAEESMDGRNIGRHRNLTERGIPSILFFMIKGLLWLLIPAALAALI